MTEFNDMTDKERAEYWCDLHNKQKSEVFSMRNRINELINERDALCELIEEHLPTLSSYIKIRLANST